MYITCSVLWEAGITKDKVSCCGSCHDDAEMFPGQYDLMEIYPDDIGLERSDHAIGSVCCAVSHFLDDTGEREEILKNIYEKEYATATGKLVAVFFGGIMKRLSIFVALIGALVVFAKCQSGVAPNPKMTTFHNCSVIGGSGNSPHLFDLSKIYKCDEGTVEIAGQRKMFIENGYVYTEELGEPDAYERPHLVTPSDYRDYKWCPKPGLTDPNEKEMCGDKPTTCWDGKHGTWDPNWRGYSCATPDHK